MASLEELVTGKKTLNLDFHNHWQTAGKFRNKKSLLAEGFSNLVGLLDKVMKSKLDILYMTNFEDLRAEEWTSEEQLELAKEAGYEIEQGDYFTFFKKHGEIKALGKSQEIPTSQGHILISGIKRYKNISSSKSIDETLIEVDDNELKTADHSYAIIGKSGILRQSKNPEEDASKFDALEKNGNFSFLSMPFSLANYLVERASIKYQKPLLANSDGHHPKDIGKTYNTFNSQNLDYSSERNFRDSINYAVRNNAFETTFKPIPFWRVFHHILMVGLYRILKKFSFVPKDRFERYSKRGERAVYEPAFAPALA